MKKLSTAFLVFWMFLTLVSFSPSYSSAQSSVSTVAAVTPTPRPAPPNSSRPAGATAKCNDGTYSFSQNRQGTCSHHGGVAEWY